MLPPSEYSADTPVQIGFHIIGDVFLFGLLNQMFVRTQSNMYESATYAQIDTAI